MTTKKQLRTAKQAVQFAIQEALEVGRILKELHTIFQTHHQNNLALIHQSKAPNRDVDISLTGHDLSMVLGALRDYTTLRIANIFDHVPSGKSLKDLELFNLKAARKLPAVKEILNSRDNWIGHINKRFIGPVPIEKLYNKEIVALLQELQYFAYWTKEKMN